MLDKFLDFLVVTPILGSLSYTLCKSLIAIIKLGGGTLLILSVAFAIGKSEAFVLSFPPLILNRGGLGLSLKDKSKLG